MTQNSNACRNTGALDPNTLYDVLIVGGGIVGCSLARYLSRFNLKIILVDKYCEVGFGVSKANSGIVHAGHHSSPDTLKGQLVVRGNELTEQWCAEVDAPFLRNGELVVATALDEMQVLEKLKAQGESKGVKGLEIWDQERTLKEEPALSTDVVASLVAPTAAVINPYELCFGLIENAVANGVTLALDNPVNSIRPEEEHLAVETPKGNIRARFVLNAAGVHGDEVAAMAGVGDFKITPRKGEEYMLDKKLKGLIKRIIFPCPKPKTKGILIIPTFDGTLMVGPTALEIEDKYDLSTTTDGFEQVFASVSKIAPIITKRDCIAEFAGLRPAGPGNDFIIGATRTKGFINVAAIQSPGLTAAPAIAEYVAGILKDEGLDLVERDDYNPRRESPYTFARETTQRQQERWQDDPRFGHIVCRCEMVTETDIIHAIHQGARTLDGVKFRTRAGMGRCQGGFCSWRVMTLLSQELGVPVEQISKRGGGSWIVEPRGDDPTSIGKSE